MQLHHLLSPAGITSKHVAAPWTCTFPAPHCTDPAAANYRSAGTILLVDTPSLCQYAGCNDTMATNYDSRVRTRLSPARTRCPARTLGPQPT